MKTQIDKLFSKYVNAPGIAAVIIKDGEQIYLNSFGLASLEHNIPITSDTVFDTGSLSKHFLGYAIAILVEQNKLSLNEQVSKYIRDKSILNDITIADLLHHKSGLPNYSPLEFYVGSITGSKHVLQILNKLTQLNFEPGTKFKYCNTGYVLLTKIIEAITNTKYSTWLKQNVFESANMIQSRSLENYNSVIHNRAIPYQRVENSYNTSYKSYPQGASAVHSTITDLKNWLLFLDNTYIKKPKFFKKIYSHGKLLNNKSIPYGHGAFIGKLQNHTIIEHGGECEGYKSALSYSPSLRTGIALLSNDGNSNLWQKVRQIYAYLLNNKEVKENKATAKPSIFSKDNLSKYTGRFFIEPGAVIETYCQGNTLHWRIYGISNFDYPLTRVAEKSFLDQDGDPIEFYVDNTGQVSAVNIEWSNGTTQAHKLKDKFNLLQYEGSYYNEQLNVVIKVISKANKLIVGNFVIGDITCLPFAKDSFTGSEWWLNQMYFTRDKKHNINELKVVIRNEMNLQFTKIN